MWEIRERAIRATGWELGRHLLQWEGGEGKEGFGPIFEGSLLSRDRWGDDKQTLRQGQKGIYSGDRFQASSVPKLKCEV